MFRSTVRRCSPLLLVPMLVAVMTGGPAGAMGNHHRDDPNPPEQVANPDLGSACGLNFVLVLDRSESVGDNAGTVRAAAKAFLGRLADTGSTASLVSFGTTATEDTAPMPLTGGANLEMLNAAVDGLAFDGDTNWEDGLTKAGDQFGAFPGGKPDLVVVVTDGHPNRWNNDGLDGPTPIFSQQAQDEAVVEANAIKAAGVHMFAIGVDGDDGLLVDPLRSITGPDEYPATALAGADWTTVDGFGQLADALGTIATDLCSQPAPSVPPTSGLSITKTGPTQAHEADQVTYTFTVTNTGEAAVSDLSITDDVLGSIPVAGTLAPGSSVEVKKGYAVPLNRADDVVNTAKVCGTPSGGDSPAPVCSTPAAHRLDVLHPAVSIDKTADPVAITGAGDVTYTYVVKNTGDIALANMVVTDDILGPITTLGSLGIGESVTVSKHVAVAAGSATRNVGTVVGTDPLGRAVSASDDATITITAVLGAVLELPRTGDDARTPLLIGLALMAGGLGLRTGTRRRRAGRALPASGSSW